MLARVLMPMSTGLFDGACRKLITLVGIMALMCFLIEQYVEPTVQNTRPSLQKVWPNAVILLTSALERLFSNAADMLNLIQSTQPTCCPGTGRCCADL